MTINQKKSLVAFYISKFNDDAFRELGYGGPVSKAMDNLLILCPNHHSLIHALNPKFDYDELQYIYPDGKTDKIILDLHLTHGKEEE